MNREQELQKEREKHPDFAKTAFRTAWIAFIVALLSTLTLCTFAVTTVETKPTQRQIMPFQRDYEPEWYIYPDSTKGTLSHHPITHEKGILIQN